MQPIHCNAVIWSEYSVMVVSVFHITSQIHRPHWIRWSEWTSAVKKNERRSLSLCHQCNWQSQTEIVWISDLWLNIYFWLCWDYLHQVDKTLSHSHTMTQHLFFGLLMFLEVVTGEITLMFSGHRLCVWFGVTRTLVVMKNAPFSAGGTT